MLRVLILGVWLSLVSNVRAQERTDLVPPCQGEAFRAKEDDSTRTLNHHAFVPFQSLPFPFVTTRLSSNTGMGVVRLKAIAVPNLGVVSTDDAKLVSFTQTFLGDFRILKWLGLSTGFGLGNAVGINSSGAFNLGINYAFGATLGLNVRLAQRGIWYLSMRGDGLWQRAEAVLPAALAQSARASDGAVTFALSSLTRGGSVANGASHLSFAIAPHPMYGVFVTGGYRYQNVDVGSASGGTGSLLFGVGNQLRLNPLGVPVVVTLGGSVQVRTDQSRRVFFSTVGSQGTTLGLVESGILYSNAKFLDAGVQLTWSVARNDRRTQAVLVLNHFW
ncbi:MAG TPA: hypothetical protein VI299_27900 [Polyangiales bacterium]